jgi:predicted SnoaL-like aldol condensation-catalyzing enzyme
MARDDGVALIRRAIEEIWNRGELALADQMFAPTYVNHGGLIPDLVRGPEAIKVSVAFVRRAFPRLRIEIDALVGDHDTVALRWTARNAGAGTTTSETLTGMTFVRVAAGQVSESWTSWDTATMLGMLDLVPPVLIGPMPTSAPTYEAP